MIICASLQSFCTIVIDLLCAYQPFCFQFCAKFASVRIAQNGLFKVDFLVPETQGQVLRICGGFSGGKARTKN